MIPISDQPERRRSFPLVTLALIATNVVVFLYQLSLPPAELARLVRAAGVVPLELVTGRDLPPPAPGGIVYLTLITSMFLHGGLLHIGSNMLYLWIFGDNVEDRFGHLRYLGFYFLCGIFASVTHIAVNVNSTVPSIGASGAIAGVLAAYLIMFPHAPVRTLLIIGPFLYLTRINAVFLIGFWFVTQLISGLVELVGVSPEDGVAFWAHIGGFVAGFLLTPLFRKRY